MNDSLKKAKYNFDLSSLEPTIIEFVTDSENVELSNQTCTLLKAGTAKINIINKETKVVLHTLTIEII